MAALPTGADYVRAALSFYDPELDDDVNDALEPVTTTLHRYVGGLAG